MKDSERLKNCHSLETNKKMWQLNTMWDLVLDPETQHKKRTSVEKTGNIYGRSVFN